MGGSVGKVVLLDRSRGAVEETGLDPQFETFIAVGGAQGPAELFEAADIAVAGRAHAVGTARIVEGVFVRISLLRLVAHQRLYRYLIHTGLSGNTDKVFILNKWTLVFFFR